MNEKIPEDTNGRQPVATPPATGDGRQRKNNRRVWLKILKIFGYMVLAVVISVLAVITVAVAYLQPERLTPLVEKYAGEYLDADVSLGRVELSFWSTFPKLELDVERLSVNSKALDRLPAETRDQLPAYSDSLLSVKHFNAGVNIPKLAIGVIALYDITIEHPAINFVQATPSLSNLDIFPESEEKEEKEEKSLSVPDFSIGTFRIVGGMPVRYFSLPDSINAVVNFKSIMLGGEKAPSYAVEISGLTDTSAGALRIENLSFGLGGEIKWHHAEPYKVALRDFNLKLGNVGAGISAVVDFADTLKVDSFDFQLPLTAYSDLVDLIPADMRGELSKIKADLSIRLGLRLTEPYLLSATSPVPSFRFEIEIPEGKAAYERLLLNRFSLQVSADVDGRRPDNSTVNLTRFLAVGEGVGFELKGEFSHLLTDPTADGTFRGGMDISRLPSALLRTLPCRISGNLRADSKFFIKRSYLTKDNFHRMRLSGEASLKDLTVSMPEKPAEFYSRTIILKLGTNSSFTRGSVDVDSLLTASLKIDTISADVPGIEFRASGLKFGVGCRNIASSADTTVINPIGGRIVAERIMFKSMEDSVRLRLRKSTIGATLRRFKGDSKKPQLHLDIATDRAFYGDRLNRAMLRKALIFVTAHPKTFELRGRNSRLTDSLTRLHPELTQDSISALARQIRSQRRRQQTIADSIAIARGEVIDMSVDNSIGRIMRQWNAKGVLKAQRVRVFTPYFPLANSMSDLNMRFTSDSLVVSDTKLRSGRSEMKINGSISNITRALTSRIHRSPIKLDFRFEGDTIDVNQIAAAAFAGAAFAERDSTGMLTIPDTDNEQALQASVQSGADSVAVLVIPSNIEANCAVSADNIIYSDIVFHDFKGNLNIYSGAVNLERMSARTDVGSVSLNALYSAPDKDDASFAFGMKVSDLRIAQFIDLMPSLDSIMPLLSDISGIINADVAATTALDSQMNLDIPSLKAAVKISGDSLVLIDPQTFRKIGKWLLFKNKDRNVINHMNVEMIVNNSQIELFPFIFDLDRYRLGVMGNNDMAMNLHYHIAVIKSPLPFKFGINVSGNIDDMKIRLGRAKFSEKNMPHTVAIADTTRINLVREIGNIFRRGVRNSKMKGLDFSGISSGRENDSGAADTISHADSLYFIKEGLIPAPDTIQAAAVSSQTKNKKQKK